MPPSASDRTGHAARLAADALLSGLLLLVLLEWLYPLSKLVEITEVYSIAPFVTAFSVFVLADTFRWNAWLVWPAKLGWIVAVTAWLHNGQTIPSADWWAAWSRELLQDAVEGVRGHIAAWEPATRTLLFLTGWSFFISVVQSFVLERRSVLWFLIMTGSFLALIQLGFSIDTSFPMLRTFAIGLLLQTLLHRGHWERWKREADAAGPLPARTAARTASPLPGLTLAGCCIAVGWLGAGLHPAAMKPMDWSRYIGALEQKFHSKAWTGGYAGNGANAGWGVTGYGSDDAELGRPLRADDRPAFTAVTSRLTYWRGEAKNYYTGRGWAPAIDAPTQQTADADMAPDADIAPGSEAAKETVTQEVRLQAANLSRQLFAGGDLKRIVSLQSADGASIPSDWVWRQTETDRYSLPALNDPLASYKVEAIVLADRSMLRDDPGFPYPRDIEERFLQLPDSLPQRVRKLAETIAGQASTPYAKAVAIERYLQEHYAYSLEDSREPAPGEDFVDHFLFTQKAGYCDHFSTAMVVLLRSVGIPARWVKGFTPGEPLAVETVGDRRQYTVQVLQKDAHAWTEAYFPSVGWVPFEPTPGFAAGSGEPAKPSAAIEHAVAAPQKESVWSDGWRRLRQSLQPAAASIRNAGSSMLSLLASFLHSTASAWSALSLWTVACIGNVVILFIAGFVHLWKKYINGSDMTKERKPDRMTGGGMLLQGLRREAQLRFGDRLWRRLQRSYGRAAPSQTLREYAASRQLRSEPQRTALRQLTALLEALRYDDPHRAAFAVTRRALADAWLRLKQSKRL